MSVTRTNCDDCGFEVAARTDCPLCGYPLAEWRDPWDVSRTPFGG